MLYPTTKPMLGPLVKQLSGLSDGQETYNCPMPTLDVDDSTSRVNRLLAQGPLVLNVLSTTAAIMHGPLDRQPAAQLFWSTTCTG